MSGNQNLNQFLSKFHASILAGDFIGFNNDLRLERGLRF